MAAKKNSKKFQLLLNILSDKIIQSEIIQKKIILNFMGHWQ